VKLVILDRDGVINEDSDAYIKSPAEWRPIAGSPEAIARLNASGYRVVVASNQSGVGRGLFDQATLSAIHDRMKCQLAAAGAHLDGIFFCPHTPAAGCACRKPAPGLLHAIARHYDITLTHVPMIGDSASDILAARAAGARPMLVRTGKGERMAPAAFAGVPRFPDLAAAVDHVLGLHGARL